MAERIGLEQTTHIRWKLIGLRALILFPWLMGLAGAVLALVSGVWWAIVICWSLLAANTYMTRQNWRNVTVLARLRGF